MSDPNHNPKNVCPHCNSTQVYAFKAIYRKLARGSTSAGRSLGLPLNGLWKWIETWDRGVLLEHVSPPKEPLPPNIPIWSIGATIILVFIGVLLGSEVSDQDRMRAYQATFTILILAFMGVVLIRAHHAMQYPNELAEWQSTWYCEQCGEDFLRNPRST